MRLRCGDARGKALARQVCAGACVGRRGGDIATAPEDLEFGNNAAAEQKEKAARRRPFREIRFEPD